MSSSLSSSVHERPADTLPMSHIESSIRYFVHDFAGLTSFYRLLKFRAKKSPFMLNRSIALHTKETTLAKSHSDQKQFLEVKTTIDKNQILQFTQNNPNSIFSLIVALVSCESFNEVEEHWWQQYGDIIDCKELVVNSNDAIFDHTVTLSAAKLHKLRSGGDRTHFFVALALRQQPKMSEKDVAMLDTSKELPRTIQHYKIFMYNSLKHFFSDKPLARQLCVIELLPKSKAMAKKTTVKRSPSSLIFKRCIPYIAGTKTVYLSSNVQDDAANGSNDNDSVDVSLRVSVAPPKVSRESRRKLVASRSPPGIDGITPHAKPSLYFHYVYHDRVINIMKSVPQECKTISCPFCDFSSCPPGQASIEVRGAPSSCGIAWRNSSRQHLSRLMHHLTCCHELFSFECSADQMGNMHVVVTRNDSKLSWLKSNEKQLAKAAKNRNVVIVTNGFQFIGGNKRSMLHKYDIQTEQLTPQSPYYNISLAESNRQIANSAIHDRPYRHSLTGTLVTDNELSYDSDNDIDSTFILLESNAGIDEFVEIAYEEKEFFKLWNLFIRGFRMYGDMYLPPAAELFARRFASVILKKGLRHNMLLHMATLWDFGLIDSNTMTRCMRIVDQEEARSKDELLVL